jgi:hypothetical protein
MKDFLSVGMWLSFSLVGGGWDGLNRILSIGAATLIQQRCVSAIVTLCQDCLLIVFRVS